MADKIFKLNFNTDTSSYIFDDCTVYKTDGLLKEMRYISASDLMLDKLAEIIRLHEGEIRTLSGTGTSYAANTERGTFFFKFGDYVLSKNDVIFFKYAGEESRINDSRFSSLIRDGFSFSVHRSKEYADDFKKLYTLSGADGVNFPLLNDSQKQIVTAEEGNVLVQGVAGSGKTNICIDRIIYAASKNYSGKILYSTYSRGLLVETENKVGVFIRSLKAFSTRLSEGKITAVGNLQKAVENKLGITLSESTAKGIAEELSRTASYLENMVDYLLIDDLYRTLTGKQVKLADESFFVKEYIGNIKNYRLSGSLEKIKNLEYEIIYKEIYGMLLGAQDGMPSMDAYVESRKNSFSRFECETIYYIAVDYAKYLEQQGYADNNSLSRELVNRTELYSLAVLDEVQDFTQINLLLFKRLSRKMFCVGDALQMINPSYFSFAYLKRLMYEKDVTSVRELTHNYRNTPRLNEIIEKLNDMNTERFGTHSFVLHGTSVSTDVQTEAIYTDGSFLSALENTDLSNCTLVVGGAKKKEELRARFKTPEILTVSEIKGLERETVVLVDLLSDNSDKWEKLYRDAVNRKTADENSAYRYWFNLLYVGISRARRNLFVTERKNVRLFDGFFSGNFDFKPVKAAAVELSAIIGKGKPDEKELRSRIDEFITLGQFDNAEFAARGLSEEDYKLQKERIHVYATDVKQGEYKNAGTAFWELGLFEEAKKYFDLSGNHSLSELVDACSGDSGARLNADVAVYYAELEDNETARKLIIDTVKKDLKEMREAQAELNKKIKALKATVQTGA